MSLKLLVNQIAVSREETFSGPNGFRSTLSSSNLSCCNNRALNSSNPSKASARCWYDEVSNFRCRDSVEGALEILPVVGLILPSFPWSPLFLFCKLSHVLCTASFERWTMHLSFVIESGMSGKIESSGDVRGNSAILSKRGLLTETLGDSMLLKRPTLYVNGEPTLTGLADIGRDTRHDGWDRFLVGVRDTFNVVDCLLGVSASLTGFSLGVLAIAGISEAFNLSLPKSSEACPTDKSENGWLKLACREKHDEELCFFMEILGFNVLSLLKDHIFSLSLEMGIGSGVSTNGIFFT